VNDNIDFYFLSSKENKN